MNLLVVIVTILLQTGSRHTIAICKEKAANGKNYIMIFLGIGDLLSVPKVSLSKACMSGMKDIKGKLMILLSMELKLYAQLLGKTT
jgi:hypothetical protein